MPPNVPTLHRDEVFRLGGSIPLESGQDPIAFIEAERRRQAALAAKKRATFLVPEMPPPASP